MPPSSFKYRPDIDGLRGIAVAAVVGFHAFPGQVTGGFIGVDVFFVISGFLITGIILDALERGTFSFADFYARRIKRILPALVLVLAACYYIGSRMLLPGDFKALGKHIMAAGTFVTNFVLWSESGYFDTDAQAKPLLHLWSLGIEEQFYLIWPALLFVFARRKLNLGYLLAGIIALSFLCNVVVVEHSTAAAFYSPATRFWELMCGAVLAYWASIGRVRVPPVSLLAQGEAAFGFACIVAATFAFNSGMDFPGWWALIPVAGTCCIIHAGPQTLLNKGVLARRPMVWLGLISYGLYLWHWPLLSFAYIAAGQEPSVETRVLLVLVAIGLAAATYLLVERPIRFWRGYDSAKVAGLCAATLGLIAVGLYCFADDGQVTSYQRALNIRSVEMKADWRGGQCLIGPDNGWPIGEAAGLKNFDGCIEGGSAPLLVLWGDSFAAALYPGIKHQEDGRSYRIAQFTFNACPPIVDADIAKRAYCRPYQTVTLEKIIALRPAYLVMASAWGMLVPISAALKTLRSMIDVIHARSPSTRVTVVGNPPIWKEPLPKLLARRSVVRNGQLISSPDVRLPEATDDAFDHDKEFDAAAASSRFGYFSPWNVLCNTDGCLSRQGRDFQILYSMDTGHLTPPASDLVGKELVPFILATGRPGELEN